MAAVVMMRCAKKNHPLVHHIIIISSPKPPTKTNHHRRWELKPRLKPTTSKRRDWRYGRPSLTIHLSTQRCNGGQNICQHNFPKGINDICVRVIPSKIFDIIKDTHMIENEGNAEMCKMTCYTSNKGIKESIGERNIDTKLFRKNGWSNRQKRVHTEVVADAVFTLYQADLEDNKGVISLWSGHIDILFPIVEKASKEDWAVEVWSFKGALSHVLDRFPEVTIRELDDKVGEFIERKTGWTQNPEKIPCIESSFKLQFVQESKELEMAKERWREIIELLTDMVNLPLQAWFKWEEAFMFVILAVPSETVAVHMEVISGMENELEKEIHEFMKKNGLTSSCKVIMNGRLE